MLSNYSQQACAMPAATYTATVEGLMQAITSCDLSILEKYTRGFKQHADDLIPLVEGLAKRVNSPELTVTVRRFSWKERGVTKFGVVCEFHLPRSNRILLVPTEHNFPSAVLEQNPGTVAVVSTDCPKLMLRQVGKMVGMQSSMCPPPPLSFAPPPAMSSSPATLSNLASTEFCRSLENKFRTICSAVSNNGYQLAAY